MAIKFCCFLCHKEMMEPGALFIRSPNDDGMCGKSHICVECEKELTRYLIEKSMTNAGFKVIDE